MLLSDFKELNKNAENIKLVQDVQRGTDIKENMERLYLNNLPLIKKFIRPFVNYEDEADLLQTAFIGLNEAVSRFDTSHGVAFMTFARFWIVQSVRDYIDKASLVRIPPHTKQKISRYKKAVAELEQGLGRFPTYGEIAERLHTTVDAILELELYSQEVSITSIDIPLADDTDTTLSDTLQADIDVENDTLDKLTGDYIKADLWGICKEHTTEEENAILRSYFLENKSMLQIADELQLPYATIRVVKQKGLRRLRTGKAKKKLIGKMEALDGRLYHTSFKTYNEKKFTSSVESYTLQKLKIEEEHRARLEKLKIGG